MSPPVKLATLLDVEHMTRIVQETFETPWSTHMLRATVLNHAYDVRVIRKPAGGLVGFFVAHIVRANSNLDIVAVDAPLRSGGIGTHLLQTWFHTARQRNLRGLTLQVNTRNERAMALYQSLDFQPTRLLRDYYPNGDNAYEMRRPVSADAEPPRQALPQKQAAAEQSPARPLPHARPERR